MNWNHVILAAGRSSRMGYPKPLITVDGSPLIRRQVRAGFDSGASDVVVVVGFHESRVREALENLTRMPRIVRNTRRDGDQTSSMKTALEEMSPLKPVLMQLVDHPVTDPTVLRRIVPDALDVDVRVPTYGDQGGHPPLFSVSFLDTIQAMETNAGINSLYRREDVRIETVPVESRDVVTDLDRPADVARLRDRRHRRRDQ